MKELSERKLNKFGIVQFVLVLCCILLIWIILAIAFIFQTFSLFDTCILCAVPIIATIFLALALIRLTSLHPLSLTINQDSMEFINLYKEKTTVHFCEIEDVKIDYLLNMKKFQIYIKMKGDKPPIAVFGVGKNIQKAVIEYSKLNNIPVEEFGFFGQRK